MSKLLIVDDEIDVCEFAKNFFKKRGVDVFTAGGGKEALEIINSEKPDLLLLDVRMAEMTGIELLRKIRGSGNDVKAIMVTGVEEEETVAEADKLGALGYIHKPLILSELEKVVMEELNKI